MPVTKPELKPAKPVFTKQDFLDGKCTADGLPIDKAAPIVEPPVIEPETVEEVIKDEPDLYDESDGEPVSEEDLKTEGGE